MADLYTELTTVFGCAERGLLLGSTWRAARIELDADPAAPDASTAVRVARARAPGHYPARGRLEPKTFTNMKLLLAAWGEKNSTTSSSKSPQAQSREPDSVRLEPGALQCLNGPCGVGPVAEDAADPAARETARCPAHNHHPARPLAVGLRPAQPLDNCRGDQQQRDQHQAADGGPADGVEDVVIGVLAHDHLVVDDQQREDQDDRQ